MKKNIIRRVGALLLAGAMMTVSASAAADGAPVDPSDPYGPPISGTFHGQTLEGYEGCYTVFIPDSFEFCSPGVMLLTPDGQTAQEFYQSDIGSQWRALCEEKGVAAVIVEPLDGAWNVDDSETARDDESYLKKVYDTIRSKSTDIAAAFDMDERAFYLIGYEEGGIAAQEFAMAWPSVICGMATVGGSAVPESVMEQWGNSLCYPFAQADSLAGQQENRMPNGEVPVPVWIIESDDAAMNSDAVVQYWVEANGAEQTAGPSEVREAYVNSQKDCQRVWVSDADTADELSPESLYDELSDIQRFVGDPGGRLEWAVNHENNGRTGFFTHEEVVDGALRRWLTYVPTSYEAGTDVPLVVALHGYTSAMTAFTGDSRWQDVAEEHGFIVLFAQAYPNYYPGRGNISAPVWHNYAYPLSEDATDDVAFIRYIVEQTETQYSIDESRIYATGHSNGSSMTWALANDCQDLFAACAPVGWQNGAISEDAPDPYTLMPIWTCMGEFDLGDATVFEEGNSNDVSVKGWIERNQLSSIPQDSTAANGRYLIHSYQNEDGVPLYNYAEILNSPHAYMPEQAEYIYEQFFSRFSRVDGVLYYDGEEVANPYQGVNAGFADLDGHWAQTAAENAVAQGWLNGTSATTFEPDIAATRGMVVTVLGRMAGAAGDVSAAAQFTDVAPDMYYAPYIGWALQEGIVSGTSSTTFEPELDITREEFAVMVANYAQYADLALAETPASLDRFSDAGRISSWAQESMQYCVDTGLLSGHDDGSLAPQGDLTRAELATILNRISAA